jgi:two-component system NarL family response regulator
MNSVESEPIRVVVVDDETLFTKMLVAWLEKDPGLKIEGSADSGKKGWLLCLANPPDVAVVDVEMDDGDGITLAGLILDKLPGTRVILLTGRVDPHTAWQAAKVGVHGLIDKTIDPELIGVVIRVVVEGGEFLSPRFQKVRDEWLTKPDAFQNVLTRRELGVLLRVTEGQNDSDIGQVMGISADTVASHRKSIRKKLGLHDDRSLVAYARKWGIHGVGGTKPFFKFASRPGRSEVTPPPTHEPEPGLSAPEATEADAKAPL